MPDTNTRDIMEQKNVKMNVLADAVRKEAAPEDEDDVETKLINMFGKDKVVIKD